jgi:hypothetical protein
MSLKKDIEKIERLTGIGADEEWNRIDILRRSEDPDVESKLAMVLIHGPERGQTLTKNVDETDADFQIRADKVWAELTGTDPKS